MRLTISIVLYQAEPGLFAATLDSLVLACTQAGLEPGLVLVDNGGSDEALAGFQLPETWPVKILRGQGNVGFGAGHNLALDHASDFHLILNPDLELAPDALLHAQAFMEAHDECGLLVPSARWGDGRVQYLCKRMPTVFDLFLRGFAPTWLKALLRHRLERYEMRDLISDRIVWDPPLVSGCCMLFRTPVLLSLKGFDERFFLYFEDFDLSLRASKITRIAYNPAFRVIHHGGYAARKGLRHVDLFVRSAVTFFKKHGWRWC